MKVVVFLLALAGVAHAYPQFQLSKDQTCKGCHTSPAGGGMLSENGLNVAETISQFGTQPEFFYGRLGTPTWLELGGDLRGAAGYFDSVQKNWVAFPMQAEVYGEATFSSVKLHVTAGMRDPQYNNEAKTLFASREHWVQWDHEDLTVRAGRFMPVFGMRNDEHPSFNRRYGGTPLYGEAYGLAVEYVTKRWEVHATGFVHDPFLKDSLEQGNGAALYGEVRVMEKTAIGLEGKVDVTPDDKHWYGGLVAKRWIAPVLVQAEFQVIHQKVDAGGTANGVLGFVMGSYFLGPLLIDLAVEAYDPNVHVRYLDQEAIDLNVHWFTSSHLELILLNHFQMQELGEGGLSSGYSMLMLHYRL